MRAADKIIWAITLFLSRSSRHVLPVTFFLGSEIIRHDGPMTIGSRIRNLQGHRLVPYAGAGAPTTGKACTMGAAAARMSAARAVRGG